MAKKIYHNAIFLADHRDEEHFEYSGLTLCFSDKGPYLLEDVFTPGTSAGNYCGATYLAQSPLVYEPQH